MAKCDLVLLHAPHVYDFRQKTILHRPVSDLVPPSPVFEMYPIGLTKLKFWSPLWSLLMARH